MCLGVRVGVGFAALHDRMMRGLRVNLLELDEAWGFLAKKQKRLTPDDLAEKGDAYTFVALDATRKAIISYRTGKRTADNTTEFAADLRARILGRPQVSSDGFRPYGDAIEWAFGSEVDYGQIVKVRRRARPDCGPPLLARMGSSAADRPRCCDTLRPVGLPEE